MMELLAIKATSAELRKTDPTKPMLMRCHLILHIASPQLPLRCHGGSAYSTIDWDVTDCSKVTCTARQKVLPLPQRYW